MWLEIPRVLRENSVARASTLTLSLQYKQNTDLFALCVEIETGQEMEVITRFNMIKIWWKCRLIDHSKETGDCCSDEIEFLVLFNFWNNQGGVVFPEGRVRAATSTNESTERERERGQTGIFSVSLYFLESSGVDCFPLKQSILLCHWGKMEILCHHQLYSDYTVEWTKSHIQNCLFTLCLHLFSKRQLWSLCCLYRNLCSNV